jgi:hypothetical protein
VGAPDGTRSPETAPPQDAALAHQDDAPKVRRLQEGTPGLRVPQGGIVSTNPIWTDSGQGDLLELVAQGSATGTADDEWLIFQAALSDAAVDGVIYPNTLRPLVRGRVAPKRIAAFTARAVARGLVHYNGQWQVSDDREGGNAGRPARVMAVGAA